MVSGKFIWNEIALSRVESWIRFLYKIVKSMHFFFKKTVLAFNVITCPTYHLQSLMYSVSLDFFIGVYCVGATCVIDAYAYANFTSKISIYAQNRKNPNK